MQCVPINARPSSARLCNADRSAPDHQAHRLCTADRSTPRAPSAPTMQCRPINPRAPSAPTMQCRPINPPSAKRTDYAMQTDQPPERQNYAMHTCRPRSGRARNYAMQTDQPPRPPSAATMQCIRGTPTVKCTGYAMHTPRPQADGPETMQCIRTDSLSVLTRSQPAEEVHLVLGATACACARARRSGRGPCGARGRRAPAWEGCFRRGSAG
ncbi:hypothetical protein SAMN04488539_1302 [Corynebacterium timonense]|uniref:Uncharacterized protein n=1 Tax=Corynebacterium timonense TaxID=441500 RepID=A0A1H1QPT3_9CORY|nr:hypothetical protein SAMN04488539_1302 [Corynebacterium timonense]